jgi:hypothetical protein
LFVVIVFSFDEEAEASGGNGFAGIDHLQHGQSVRPVGLSSAGRPPQNPRVDASWEVISANALRCSGSADIPVVFPRELPFPRFYPWELRRELQKPLSLTEISLNYFPPDVNRSFAMEPETMPCYGFFMNLSKLAPQKGWIDSFLNIGASDFL